jgi:hypothetical protein
MPAYYYPPAFYGWAYNPWPAPAPYVWGWGAALWYGYYGAYFRPYPVYPSAAYWLTDYMVAASLQEAYAAGVAAGQSSAELRDTKPRLIFTSYDPATDTTSPVTRAVVPRLHRSGAVAQSDAVPAAPAPVAAAPAHRGPVTVALGQTPDEVVAMKGQPLNKVILGAKTIYVHSYMKIVFMRDKVSDVQ